MAEMRTCLQCNNRKLLANYKPYTSLVCKACINETVKINKKSFTRVRRRSHAVGIFLLSYNDGRQKIIAGDTRNLYYSYPIIRDNLTLELLEECGKSELKSKKIEYMEKYSSRNLVNNKYNPNYKVYGIHIITYPGGSKRIVAGWGEDVRKQYKLCRNRAGFKTLEECSLEDAQKRKQYHIDNYFGDNLINTREGGRICL